jgi:UDP:flavonoid glycosyltransferase YjiC (YdhE family)
MGMHVMVKSEHRQKSLPDRNRAVKCARFARRSSRTLVRILFAPHGTRGDIQPLTALAQVLEARGHRITFVAPENAVRWIRARGFACESNGVDVEAEVRAIASSMSRMHRRLRRMEDEVVPRLFESVARAAADAELLVSSGIPLSAASVAEARGIPHVYALFCPGALPNRAGPPPVVKRQTLPGWVNALLWRVLPLAADVFLRQAVNKGRASLGLALSERPTKSLMNARILVAADPELAPIAGGLPPRGLATDPWILRDGSRLDARIETFIRAGSPPVYVGFGSMVAKPSFHLGQCVMRAARLAGRRVIVAGGWASIDNGLVESDDVLTIDESPHDKLLPLVAAAVHHGGAGTTTAALRAGIPQVIIPHMLDQFYWGRRVELLGVGPEALPVTRLSEEALARRITAALDGPACPGRAKSLGLRAAGRDGAAAAAEYLERLTCTNELV